VLRLLTLEWVERRWRLPVFIVGGIALGLSLLVVRISNATSYLSDNATTCLNCHVMTNAYSTWLRGSHGHVTVCNDCHIPHSNPVAMLAFKASDGARHATVFTLRREPQVLHLNPAAVPVVQSNCIRCHAERLFMIRLATSAERPCWSCHHNIHGQEQSLSGSPDVRRPRLSPAGFTKSRGALR
jgi:cytochrome c nitrite reductase small subunit